LLVGPIFEENGQAEVIFPSGSNWIYYFDRKKIFKGGNRGYFTFKLN
jgi:alpha-glucosidase (family GH31 glycosyl hydrolase)